MRLYTRNSRPARVTAAGIGADPTHQQGPRPLRYTDDERLALGFWASARLREAPAAERLATLRHYPGLEKVDVRCARRALDSHELATMEVEATVLWAKCLRLHERRLRLRVQVPLLYDAIVA